jgi:ABC-type nitrate/sulfonate/bicarbonate transport system substrate-binding protein
VLLFVALIAACPNLGFAQRNAVRVAIPTLDIVTLPLKMAQAKGFYRNEGLEVEMVLVAGALGVKAVLGNSVDFTTASGSILAAAIRGVPVKLVLIIAAKPTFDLVAEPKVESFPQLKGKLVGISTRGGTFEHVTRLILERNGLNPDKDITLLALGRQDDLHLAFKAGRISAAIYSPPRNLMLYREGFRKLAFSGDYLPHYPIGGLGVTDENIKRKPAEIQSFVARQSGRFTAMAAVPLQDPRRAAEVLEHAVAQLGHRGAFIGTNVNGRYFDSADFDPLWAKAQELDVVVVMHPEHPAGMDRMGAYGLNAVCGNPADTTLSLGYLLYSGVFDRFPKPKAVRAARRRILSLSTGPLRSGICHRTRFAPCASFFTPERLSQEPLLRYLGLSCRHTGLSEGESRRRSTDVGNRLPLYAGGLDGRG